MVITGCYISKDHLKRKIKLNYTLLFRMSWNSFYIDNFLFRLCQLSNFWHKLKLKMTFCKIWGNFPNANVEIRENPSIITNSESYSLLKSFNSIITRFAFMLGAVDSARIYRRWTFFCSLWRSKRHNPQDDFSSPLLATHSNSAAFVGVYGGKVVCFYIFVVCRLGASIYRALHNSTALRCFGCRLLAPSAFRYEMQSFKALESRQMEKANKRSQWMSC